jgi:hypothetical protein
MTQDELKEETSMSLHPPIARNTDPQTSHLAEERYTQLGKRCVRQRQCLELIASHPGSTAGELSRAMYAAYPDLPFSTCAETPHKRAADLVEKNLVKVGNIRRRCTDTGYLRQVFFPTDYGLRELQRLREGE